MSLEECKNKIRKEVEEYLENKIGEKLKELDNDEMVNDVSDILKKYIEFDISGNVKIKQQGVYPAIEVVLKEVVK
jgi:vacuolar-type H+-ATPase subunit E/Vma4